MTVAELMRALVLLNPAAQVGEQNEDGRFFPLQRVETEDGGQVVLLDCFVEMA